MLSLRKISIILILALLSPIVYNTVMELNDMKSKLTVSIDMEEEEDADERPLEEKEKEADAIEYFYLSHNLTHLAIESAEQYFGEPCCFSQVLLEVSTPPPEMVS